jgi:hypothetical protein
MFRENLPESIPCPWICSNNALHLQTAGQFVKPRDLMARRVGLGFVYKR